ncbi:MAG: DUF3237 domain-containing protein [Hyphomonadaceae bacterium]|nr:DUF3237 domain-containing protein [Hyphomonadaceae bacterium]
MSIDRRSLLLSAGVAAAAACATTPASEPQARRPEPESLTGDIPVIGLRHAFSVSIFFEERITIASVRGRVFVPAVGGEVWGPRLQGRVVPYGGADFAVGGALDAHYMLEASDGALIYINNRGFMKAIGVPPAARPAPAPLKPGEILNQRMQGTALADVPLRMRLTPTFDAPEGPHGWMNRTLFVGHGGRFMNPDHTIFTYYEVL